MFADIILLLFEMITLLWESSVDINITPHTLQEIRTFKERMFLINNEESMIDKE